MKDSEVIDALAYFRVLFPQVAVPERAEDDLAIPVWVQKLADLEQAEVQAAIDRLAVAGYPPNVVQIRADVLAHRSEAPSFGEAWAEMVEAASTCDWFGALPEFSHPAVRELARQIGWDEFRRSDPADTYAVHQASGRYAEITRRAVERELAGLPAFQTPDELPEGMAELVEGIFGKED